MNRHSLKWRMLVLLLAFILIPMIAVAVVMQTKSSAVMENKLAEIAIVSAEQAGEKLDVMLDQYDRFSMQVLMDKEVQRLLDAVDSASVSDKIEQSSKAKSKLKELMGPYKEMLGIYLIARDSETESRLPVFNKLPKEKREAMLQSVKEGAGKVVYLGMDNSIAPDEFLKKQKVLVFGRTLKRISDSKEQGVLLFEIKADAIKETLSGLQFGKQGNAYLVNRDNRITVAVDEGLLGSASPASVLNRDEGHWRETVNGIPSMIIRTDSQKTGWQLVAVIPLNEMLKDLDVIRSWLLIMILAAVLIVILLSYGAAAGMIRPIERLSQVFKQGESGDLTALAEVKGKNELAQLGGSFNQMMERIRSLFLQTRMAAEEVWETSNEVMSSSGRIAAHSREIVSATDGIALGAEQQAGALEHGASLVVEMGRKMKLMAEQTMNLQEVTVQVQERCTQGSKHMGILLEKNRDTEKLMADVSDQVGGLLQRLGSIEKVLHILQALSKQTNILSLNAAIEANRAGPAGKGFMVVGNEIRLLAQQTANSVKEVGALLESIRKDMDGAQLALARSKPALKEQLVCAADADGLFREVDGGMLEAGTRLEEWVYSLKQLEKLHDVIAGAITGAAVVAEQSTATAQEVASSASEQHDLTEGLVRWAQQLDELSQKLQLTMKQFQI